MLYRVTFLTEILIDARDECEAERIGDRNLESEVRNCGSEVYRIEELKSVDQLRRVERGSLPWRATERGGEPELLVEEILGGK
jgi:hypothetical protein